MFGRGVRNEGKAMKKLRTDSHESAQAAATPAAVYAPILPEPNNCLRKPSRDPINMLVARPVADAFKHFCKIERYRYHEALEEIMKRAGLLPRDFGGSA
jgi:hypothetical protein